MTVLEKIDALRREMKKYSISAYIIVTDDFHGSEYVGEYFKARSFMSGFTGSAGSLVITMDWAGLWTDGRYFLQAERQLNGTGIELMRIGEDGVPAIGEYIGKNVCDGEKIGFDGRTVSSSFVEKIVAALGEKQVEIVTNLDLVNNIWTDRPEISKEPVWELDIKYAGCSREEKMAALREKLEENNAVAIVLTALDEIAWLLNLRGNDVECTPVFLAYMVVLSDKAVLFVHKEILDSAITLELSSMGIEIRDYDSIYSDLADLLKDKAVIIDGKTANYRIIKSVSKSTAIIDIDSPVIMMKAVKNPVEMDNIRRAHLKDSIAVTRFMYWLEKNAGKGITELDAAARLEELRRLDDSYLGPSFTSIVAYESNGAIIHYCPTAETNRIIGNRSLCLCDVGGHYLYGTTDMTRTVVMGQLTDEEKLAYTIALKGHLNLGDACFKYGLTGANLDYLARNPLWEYGMDYNHGTGHGVGYLLNVHEGPQRFHWRSAGKAVALEEGMVISNEPGYYEENKFGIRHENLLMVTKAQKTQYGQFMRFENLTMVPFDRRGLKIELMNSAEIEILNNYHREVYERLAPFLEGQELDWLKDKTSQIDN
ncbi:MAG: aminopeptidase P family protein [Lachnospiraceae bacterium]